MEGILPRCRREVDRHLAGPDREHTVTGVGEPGAAITGVDAIGAVAIGAIIIIITTLMSSSSAISAFRSGVGAGDIHMDITAAMAMATATATATATMAMGMELTEMIMVDPVTDPAMATDLAWWNCNAVSRVPATTMAPSMELWGHKPDVPFAPLNAHAAN